MQPVLGTGCSVTDAPSSSGGACAGRTHEASDTQHEHCQVHEGLKRGGAPVHPVAQAPEALEPAERPLDHIALPLQQDVLGIQLADGLLCRDAAPGRDSVRFDQGLDVVTNCEDKIAA